MKKTIDIEKYDDFIKAGFKECHLCGWAFDQEYFDGHDCKKMIEDTLHPKNIMPK